MRPQPQAGREGTARNPQEVAGPSTTADLASGGTSSLTEEQLRYANPAPGHYRVEVHNWAGLPGTRVDLTLTYLNAAGEPGPAA